METVTEKNKQNLKDPGTPNSNATSTMQSLGKRVRNVVKSQKTRVLATR